MQDVQPAIAGATFNGTPHVPAGAQGHFLLHFYAVVARVLERLSIAATGERNGAYFERFPFLVGYQSVLASLAPDGIAALHTAWWEAQIAAWEARTAVHLPLRELVEGTGLSKNEVRVLIAAGLVE